MPARKIIIFFLIIFFLLFVFTDFALAKKCATHNDCQRLSPEDEPKRTIKCINERCVRALEITYPKIAGEVVPTTVASGLPAYVKYVFTLAVVIIGLVIFGVLIYNGVLYLTSAGRPEQMTEAKKGILYAFLGGVILLASGIIFNTINPQLKIMELAKVDPLEQVVVPGVYICNYKVDNIGEILKKYIEKKGEEQIEAAKELRKIIWNPETKRGCPRVNFSSNLQNFKVTKNETIFIVPSLVLTEEGRQPIYRYGIVLHERDNFGGQCYLVETEAGENKIYGENGQSGQIKNYSAQGLKFTARSVTVFQKPLSEPQERSVDLYECLNYNREGKCTENDPPLSKMFIPKYDLTKVDSGLLGKLKENSRSITFSPLGSYFALLFEGKNFDKRCKLLRKNNPNLMDLPIGMCPTGCKLPLLGSWLVKRFTGSDCAPCLNSMIIVKGSVL